MRFYLIAIRRAVTNATCLFSQPLEIQAYRDLSLDELAERTEEAKHKLGDRVIMLGHNYQRDEVIRHADVEGDSLKDRKSTRLNSSHLGISYAVFCLKKKK